MAETTLPPDLIELAMRHRIEIERELGARSLYEFFKMCWHEIDANKFIDNWHIKLLCDELQAMACRQKRNVAICIPPRHGKSLLVSVAFVAWVWTWWPHAKFITASYDIRLSTRDAVACRRLVQSKWYQDRWGAHSQIRPDRGEKTYYETIAGGHRYVTSPTAGVTGHGADFILADDPHNVAQAESEADRETVRRFWFEAIPSRLDRPDDGVKVVIQQRVHEKDLAGMCIERGYHPVVLPAIAETEHPHRHPLDFRQEGEPLWPDRMSLETVKALAIEMGSYAAAGQLQQRPAPREGGMFKRHWFRVVEAAPNIAITNAVRRWDLASSIVLAVGDDPDWTVGVKMGRDEMGNFYIIDVVRFRATPGQVEQAMKAIAFQDHTSTMIGIPEDPGQAGKSQAAYLVRQMAPFPVRSERETGDKETRARPLAAQAEAGNVYLVRGAWNEEFLDEVCSFPNAAHDDQVDAATGAFRMLTEGHTGMLEFLRQQVWNQEPPDVPSTNNVERHYYGLR